MWRGHSRRLASNEYETRSHDETGDFMGVVLLSLGRPRQIFPVLR